MKMLGNTGLSKLIQLIKTWVTNKLSGYSTSSHTHSYLPLTGGTVDGDIYLKSPTNKKVGFMLTETNPESSSYRTNLDIGWNWTNRDGSGLALRSVDNNGNPGGFYLYARDATNTVQLAGYPDGTLTWDGNDVSTKKIISLTTQYVSNSVITQTEFNRCSARIANNCLVFLCNMNPTSGKTTSDIITVGKIKNVNIVPPYDIEVTLEQNATFKPCLICLYNNGSDVDVRFYSVSGTGGGRIGHVFTIPLA